TLDSGIKNAIIIGKELKKKGKKIGVRIDSGDLSYLSKEVRQLLDQAGLEDAVITVSNDLSEDIIHLLVSDQVPIDSWGVGTHLVTGGNQASMNGVYKLAAKMGRNNIYESTMKVSNNYEKTTNPGIKQVYRFIDAQGNAKADLIALQQEIIQPGRTHTFFHPMIDSDYFSLSPVKYEKIVPLLRCKMEQGKRTAPSPSLLQIREYAIKQLESFHRSYKRLINPHVYKVSLSKELKDLKQELIALYRSQEEIPQ
ncbi:MAG: nicotinate phosphoribosyltransferase, partial [Spirochaetales bacterium]|nr:nicotinate phosphoribosyltransferase [Spirochaetales bacterium]